MQRIQNEKKTLVFILSIIFVLSTSILFAPLAMSELGASALVAENLYNALAVVGYGAAAASVVSSFGLGSVAVTAVVAAARKWSLKKFTTW